MMQLRAICTAGVAALFWVSPLPAQLDQTVPGDLEEVGITQRLDESLPLDLSFTDSKGNPVRLGQYFDGERPVLLSLVYYRCPMLCTLVLDGMLESMQGIDWVAGKQFQVVTISIDPREGTTLARQKKQTYLKAYGRPEAAAGWHFLTGDQESIRTVADAVGFHYRFLPDVGEFAHAASLFVITPEGQISRYLLGVQHDSRTVKLSLAEAAEGKIGSVVDKFLLYCYRYDAEAGRYAPVAMNIMRVGGALTLLILGCVILTLWLKDQRQRQARTV